MPKEKATADRVMSGVHFMLGNYALVEGAISAGCNFFAGYPITPANEISERMSQRLPEVGAYLYKGKMSCVLSMPWPAHPWQGQR